MRPDMALLPGLGMVALFAHSQGEDMRLDE
jgi:hypothetical protein